VSRLLRFVPEENTLVEVTCRILQSMLLLKPGHPLNEIIIGALARAKRRYGVRLCCFSFVSNHFHLLLEVDSALQLARFVGYFNSKLAKEVGRLTGWREKIFGRRYQAILVSPEEAAQIERFMYVLAHGAKEGLVDSPRQWPGVHAVRALLGEEELKGYWFDRTKEYAARHRGETFDRLKYATTEELTLDPLPCWKRLSAEERRNRVAAMVAEIEAKAALRREQTGVRSLGPAAILAQDPRSRPAHSKRSPAPFCHATSRDWRRLLRGAYAEFVAAFRRAAERLKAGDRAAPFPIGSFPPALPFVGG
jgi:putative transposase